MYHADIIKQKAIQNVIIPICEEKMGRSEEKAGETVEVAETVKEERGDGSSKSEASTMPVHIFGSTGVDMHIDGQDPQGGMEARQAHTARGGKGKPPPKDRPQHPNRQQEPVMSARFIDIFSEEFNYKQVSPFAREMLKVAYDYIGDKQIADSR